MSGVDGGQSQNAPPLELMHLAAAANTVVGDKYGLFFCFFLLFSFFFVFLVSSGLWRGGWGRRGVGGCKGERRSNASVR